MLLRIVPSAVPRCLIADERLGFSYRAKMFDVTLGREKSGRIADDAIAKLSLASKRPSQPAQHLVFWDGDIPLGHNFFGHVRRGLARPSGPPPPRSDPTGDEDCLPASAQDGRTYGCRRDSRHSSRS